MVVKCPLVSNKDQWVGCIKEDCALYTGSSCSILSIAVNLDKFDDFIRIFNAMTDQLSMIRLNTES
jgi:hypothetical protein